MQLTNKAKGIFEAKTLSGETYMVDIINQTCTCKSWYYKTNRPCKHLRWFEGGEEYFV